MSAPMRIDPRQFQRVDAADNEGLNSYLDRLMKMVPGEVVGLYLVGRGYVTGDLTLFIIWVSVCFAGVVAVKAYGTSDKSKKISPDWTHTAISSVAFLLWVYSMGETSLGHLWKPNVAALLVLAWTFFIPIVYKGPTT